MKNATYHGITKATCLSCGTETTEISELEMMNDLDNRCDSCDTRFTKWETKEGVFVTYEARDHKGNNYYFREEI
jgi:DNA-directed RNA polymerase subunit RPC12/RpoP